MRPYQCRGISYYLFAFLLLAAATAFQFHNEASKLTSADLRTSLSRDASLSISGSQIQKTEATETSNSPMRGAKGGILSRDGASLSLRRLGEQNFTFFEDNLRSNMITTQKYLLIGQDNQTQPTLKRLNLESMTLQTIVYPAVSGWRSDAPAVLADLKNGDYAYAEGYHIFILNNKTLEITQTIQMESLATDPIVSMIVYSAPKKNESLYLFGRRENKYLVMTELLKGKSQEYETKYQFIMEGDEKDKLYPTELNMGLSYDSVYVYDWANFHTLLQLSYEPKYCMKSEQQIAVSYDQSFFVVRDDSYAYQLYNINDNFEITLKRTIIIGRNQHKRGATTSDDKALFVSTANLQRDNSSIAKIDVKTGQFVFLADKDGDQSNHIDFNLFHAKHNRMVTLIKRQQRYYLQLRAIDTLAILSELSISFGIVQEYKLLGSAEWDLSFVLAVRSKTYVQNSRDNAALYLFMVKEDKIILTNFTATASFSVLEACSKYVVSYLGNPANLRMLHFSNLTKASEVYQYSRYETNFIFQKNVLLVRMPERYIIYNFEQSLNYQGWVYHGQQEFDPQFLLIFPKKKMLYEAAFENTVSTKITKKVYNISVPSVSKLAYWNTAIRQLDATYYTREEGPSSLFSIFVDFFFSPLYFYLVQQRKNQSSESSFIIQTEDYIYKTAKIYISTDRKYISVLLNQRVSNRHLLQVRAISSIEQVIHQQELFIDRSSYKYLAELNVDIVNGSLVIIHAPYFVSIFFMEPKELASSHQMIEITHYDISSHIVALAGPSAFNERNTVIVVKAIRSEEYIFATIIAGTAEIIALSPEGSFLATYTSDSIVRVWNASSKKLVLAEDHPGVSKLEVGEESLSMTFKSVSKIVKRSWEKGSSKHQEVQKVMIISPGQQVERKEEGHLASAE